MTPAEKLVYDAIVRRHASGKEPVIRFAPKARAADGRHRAS